MAPVVQFQRHTEDYLALQARETLRVDRLARMIALENGTAYDELDRSRKAECRFLACYVIRSMNPEWRAEANRKAKAALIHAMQHEAGSRFVGLSEGERVTLGSILLNAMRSAYTGVLERGVTDDARGLPQSREGGVISIQGPGG